jgi:cholesterol 7-dehydrogenase
MGANLGVTGRVVGNDIACPFHGWQFSGEGACTHIPYATTDKVPSFVKTKAWHCVETNGSIMIWHDAEGRPPLWMVPDLKEINTGRYKSHGSTLHRVRAHIQEIPENGPDTAHLNHLHLPIGVRLLSAFGFHHGWDATWEAGTGLDEHLVCQSISLSLSHTHTIRMTTKLLISSHLMQTFMAVKESVQFRGIYVPGSRIDVDIVQVGPGIVHLQFATPFGKVMLIQTVTPIQPLLQQVGHQVFAGTYLSSPPPNHTSASSLCVACG